MKITDRIYIDESELEFSFVRASGPGGQHVNTASTAVQLRFNVAQSPSLPEAVRQRLLEQASSRITQDGVLIIEASQRRSQHRNRREARQRFKALVLQATRPPKRRRKTRPSRGARRRRLENKRHRSRTKDLRKPPREY